MKPYYERNGITIYCGDCLSVLDCITNADAIITDPPYGTNDGRGKVQKLGSNLVNFNVGEWDKSLPTQWIPKAMSALKSGNWIIVFTDNLSVKTIWDAIENNGGNGKQTFYWIKANPPPQPRKNFCSGVETAVVATKGIVREWYGGGWCRNYYECPIVTSDRTPHPTQKPLPVILYILKAVSKKGSTILDPFMGS